MFGIIDRYFFLEATKVFLAIVGILMLVVVSMLLLRTLEEVNIGALNTDLLLNYLVLQILRDTSSLLPPAFFLALLVALGRMAKDSELIALGACGVGPGRVYRALLYFAFPVAAATTWFSLVLQPWASAEIYQIRAQQREQAYQIAGIQEGRFYQQHQGGITFYVEEILDQRRLRNVFIHDRREGKTRLVVSKSGTHGVDPETGDHHVFLINGRRYDGTPGKADYGIAEFERYSFRIEPREIQDVQSDKRAGLPTRELLGSDDLAERAELEHRLSSPLAIFVLALVAVPLTAISPRQRTSARMFLAFVTYFCFFNLQRLAESWLETGFTPSWMGSLWYQLAILVLVYAVLVPETYWVRRVKTRFSGEKAPLPG